MYHIILTGWVEVNEGQELEKVSREIKQLYFALYPRKSTNGITNNQIEQARAYDTRELAMMELEKAKRTGDRVIGLCPLHRESHPSFVVFSDGGWKCFGCGASGQNALDYLIKVKGVKFKEAVKILN